MLNSNEVSTRAVETDIFMKTFDTFKDKSIKSFIFDKKYAEICSFAVVKEFQGKKIGTLFLKRILEELKLTGIKEVKLVVQVTNIPAVKLYKNFGFNIIKEDDMYYNCFDNDDSKAYI